MNFDQRFHAPTGRARQGEVAFERTDAGANIGNAHTLLLLDPAGFETASVIPVVEPDQAVDADQRHRGLGCARVLGWFGAGVRWLGVLLFCWMTWGLFVPERSVMPPDVVEEVLVIILKITIIVCGSLVAGRLVLAKCSRWLEWAASRLGVNEYAVLGLLTSLVSSVSMLPLYPRMDARGRMINAAFTVSGAFVLGGQMAFAAGVADGRAVAAYFATKLAGGLLALILVFCFAKNTEAVYTTDISVTQGQK